MENNKIILLVGLMGSGKTSVGKRLAKRLGLPFVDGDQEIEKAAGLPLVDVLKCFGEEEYRAGEARVMKRLLQGEPCVLASGGALSCPPRPVNWRGSTPSPSGSKPTLTFFITAPPAGATARLSKATTNI